MGRPASTLHFMQSRVEIREDLLFVWRAFHDLSGDRQTGMSVGRIPFSSVDRYAARFGVDDRDDFERFMGLIRAMDLAFVEWAGKQVEG